MEARLAHPIFDPVRGWLAALDDAGAPSLESLNALAAARGVRTTRGQPVRFVPPTARQTGYERRVFEYGEVETRPGNHHDLFNALAWLAFPKTKAAMNAVHAAEMPLEAGRRGSLRDLVTIFDEGGVIVACRNAELVGMARDFRWKALFWTHRARVLRNMRLFVIGHAVMEKALDPWPGVTCKALFVTTGEDPDSYAAGWLARLPRASTPRVLTPLPVFGYPGWLAGNECAEFYDDAGYFRPRGVKWSRESARQPLRAGAEESPGSIERDAG